MKKLLLLIFIFSTLLLKAQKSVFFTRHLPLEYSNQDSNGDFGPFIENDFDGDGYLDLAIILFHKKNGLPIFCIYLSSKFNVSKTFKYCDWIFMMHSLTYQNGIITLASDSGSMGIFGSMKLVYDRNIKDIKIIKYEDNSGSKTMKFKIWKI